jgi:nitroimidazol reductase NimA-like FMN-containing flavoprotein (pyridoxamine 5'-phosphate oxidase superfamily)/GNAT superfamily N-acetyltransferase
MDIDNELPVTERTRLHRRPQRARTDRAALEAILDEAAVVHVGFAGDAAQPFVLPTTFVRIGRAIYLHGATANRTLRAAAAGAELCAAVTLLDGLVLARSAFHHSMNYRSAVIFGRARELTDAGEKRRVLAALVDRFVPGRSSIVRPPSDAELAATLLLELPLDEASVKARSGPPLPDEEADAGWPAWTGVIPMALRAGAPVVEGRAGDYAISDDRSRIDVARVTGWLAAEYWARGIPEQAVVRGLDSSAVVAGAYTEAGEQVGHLRVVSDRVRFAYLADVFVAPAHRRRGLGRALVRFALAHPELAGVARWMLGTRDAHAVYAAEGFAPLVEPERFMERVRPLPW